jgi:hypothetical protein
MAGAHRKRYAKEKQAAATESSSGKQSSGKESSFPRDTTRSSPQSLARYDGNRDPNPAGTAPAQNVITSANLRRLEMSFGMWAAYRGVSRVPLFVSLIIALVPCVINHIMAVNIISHLHFIRHHRLSVVHGLLRPLACPQLCQSPGDCKMAACICPRHTPLYVLCYTCGCRCRLQRHRFMQVVCCELWSLIHPPYLIHLTHLFHSFPTQSSPLVFHQPKTHSYVHYGH